MSDCRNSSVGQQEKGSCVSVMLQDNGWENSSGNNKGNNKGNFDTLSTFITLIFLDTVLLFEM